jgi:hypothetical protein
MSQMPEGQSPQQPVEPAPLAGSDPEQGPAAAMPAAVEGVALQPVATGRSHRFRWAIAGAVVLVVALVTAAGAFVLSGASGTKSLTADVAPKSTTAFMEFRIDLPGDQHQKLADFMSHFPGFADRAQFDGGLDEIFNKLTRTVVPDLAYTSAFKPWMEGEVSVAALPGSGTIGIPPLGGLFSGGAAGGPTSMVMAPREEGIVIVALKDRAAAQAWIDGELASVHVTTTSQTYAGETMYTLTGADQGAYALTSQDLIVGTVDGVKAALDSKTNGSLADDADYQAAMKSLSGDVLARFYMSPRATVQPYAGFLGGLMQAAGTTSTPDLSRLPAWIAGSVRAESDRMVMELTVSSGDTGSGNHTSAIAPYLPGATVAVVEAHSVGSKLAKVLDGISSLGDMGGGSAELQQVTAALGLIGGVDWIQDAAVAVTDTNGSVGGGLVVQTTDASTAQGKVALLTNAVALAGGTLGLTSSSETYNGHTITVIKRPADPTNGMPAVEIGVTTKDNMIVAGYGDSFAKEVIDTTQSTALSAQSDYRAVMDAVGASNAGSCYVNVPALEDQLGQMAVDPTNWNTNYKPYFDHLGGIGFASIDGSSSTMRAVVRAR